MFMWESWSRGLLVLDVVLVHENHSWNPRFLVVEWFLVYILYINSSKFNTEILN